MTWFFLAVASAILLGFYDVFKKQSLRDNAVIPVLLINTALSSLLFLPLLSGSQLSWISPDSRWYIPPAPLTHHLFVMGKAVIVLSSWVCGYFAIKHLPLTLVGPINATRPVMTLMGALLIYHEQFNAWQWAGVLLAICSFFLLSRSGRKEGIHFLHNHYILLLILAAVLGACSGLYDKFLLAPTDRGGQGLNALFVQSWFNYYQLALMLFIYFSLWWPSRHRTTTFTWRWSIVGISLFLTAADLFYFYALSIPGALIAVVSMTRRSSVLVSFLFGAFLLHENNLRSKAVDLTLVFLSMLCLCLGAIFG